jgi:hypothetical protein
MRMRRGVPGKKAHWCSWRYPFWAMGVKWKASHRRRGFEFEFEFEMDGEESKRGRERERRWMMRRVNKRVERDRIRSR